MFAAGTIRPYIGARFPLAETPAALRHVADRKALGKVVIDVADGSGFERACVAWPAVYSYPMSEVPPTGDEVELGALLALVHGAADPFRTVQATYRTWRHDERASEAFLADVEERRRGGAHIKTFSFVRSDRGDPEPQLAETEETVRIWRDGERVRQEHHGGQRDGHDGVADGPLWWFWDEHMGARSNQADPSVGSGIGQELQVMLDPTPLLSFLNFRVAGNSEVAGRATITAQAAPRPEDPHHARFVRERHDLGTGAHLYQFEVDRERGVLLAANAIRDGQPFHKITTLAIRFDEPIPAETFRFVPPAGEEIHSVQSRRDSLRPISLAEAQQRAPFTVLMPDHVPTNWRMYCMFIEASQRRPIAAHVSLSYHSATDMRASRSRSRPRVTTNTTTSSTTRSGKWWTVMGRRSGSGAPKGLRPRHTSNATERQHSSFQTTSEATNSQRSLPV